MKVYAWNADENERLIRERGISIERIVHLIEHGGLLDTIAHPNRYRFPRQRIHVVDVGGYAHLVPFVESEEHYFLKTIIPSRKATKQYLEPSDV